MNRTTITVAHRVKTIMKSDIVYVLHEGELIEKGHFKNLERYRDHSAEEEEKDEIVEKMRKSKKDEGFLDMSIDDIEEAEKKVEKK